LVLRPLTGLLYQPQIIDVGDCGAICGMNIGREGRCTRREPAPMPLCPPQIPHDQTRARTRAATVESQRVTPGCTPFELRHTLSVHLPVATAISNSESQRQGQHRCNVPLFRTVLSNSVRVK
jgi:hypothetical protein